jgi:hypothetical protein
VKTPYRVLEIRGPKYKEVYKGNKGGAVYLHINIRPYKGILIGGRYINKEGSFNPRVIS